LFFTLYIYKNVRKIKKSNLFVIILNIFVYLQYKRNSSHPHFVMSGFSCLNHYKKIAEEALENK